MDADSLAQLGPERRTGETTDDNRSDSDRHRRGRDILVVVLTLTSGAVDAATFLRLGHVFSSVVTGNLVLLGIAAGQRSASLALSGGLALAGYAAGVLLGGVLAGESQRAQPVWPRAVTVALGAEFTLLAGFTAGWLLTGGRPGADARLILLAVATVAMGVQTAAVRRLGQMSSTYLTSTLAGLVTALAVRRRPEDWQRSSGTLLGIVTGALLGALTATQFPDWLPVVILAPLAVAITASLRIARPDQALDTR
ncbi:MAG TPA: YoaK family protein [Streptosporangiaceae bacterium]|nr:YoaK family protein [Streptosporangiaceae bacterium]